MRSFKLLLLLIGFTFTVGAFNVVGYLPSYRFYAQNSIQYDKLTHLMVCFANPDETTREFVFPSSLTNVVQKAHAAGCKVYVSIGGGGLSAALENIYEEETKFSKRNLFIHSLMQFVRKNNLDGVDVDLEGALVQMNTYNDFVLELIDSAHASNIKISAAYAKWNGGSVSTATVEKLDFINTMSYDTYGPWSQTSGQHSPFSQATSEFSYWHQRGADKKDVMIGLPFYGYEFQDNTTPAWTWCSIVNTYPDSLNQDNIITNDGTLYFNGISTIKQKVQFAIDNDAGGVMIWEVGQDCFDSNSMLNVIHDVILENNVVLGHEDLQRTIQCYPNPTKDKLFFNGSVSGTYTVFDISGKLVQRGVKNYNYIDISSLKSGLYTLVLQGSETLLTTKVVKK